MTNKTYGLQQCSSYVFLDIVHRSSSAQNNITKGIIFVCFVFMYLMTYKLVPLTMGLPDISQLAKQL